ncbi:MAG: tRNA (N6-threonylcarbamoyladenosine(37)-N6)-methyltransferase TrmO [Methanobacterium sp.]|nr:tRNA (N6-threonylcarbamoyladenosine(37)-N6)-methyltransferase TrmO [Methanobacterium sp.]
MKLFPIGIIRSPYKNITRTPRQGRYSEELSEIVINDEYIDGLDSLENHKHLIILYWLDRADRNKLKATPPGEHEERGVFSIRSPSRPNPIAHCLVEVVKIEENIIQVKWLDALDGSPLLDIKPFVYDLDCI